MYEDGDVEDMSQEEVRMRRQTSEPTTFEYEDAEGKTRLIDVKCCGIFDRSATSPVSSELMIDLESKIRIDLLPFTTLHATIRGTECKTIHGSEYLHHTSGFQYVLSRGWARYGRFRHLALCGHNSHHVAKIGSERQAESLDAVREDMDYSLEVQPHDDTTYKTKPLAYLSVNVLQEKGFAPSHFVLQPQEYVHINKGRLHAFRKVSKIRNGRLES